MIHCSKESDNLRNALATENGVVDLYGKTLKQRAQALISIAHPYHQDALDRAAYERFSF